MRIGAFHCGGDRSPRAVIDPFDANPGRIEYFPYMFFLVEHPAGRVLYDTGLNAKWLGESDQLSNMAIEATPSDAVDQLLAAAELRPEDIDQVIASHLHYDHAGGLANFRHAKIYVHPAELEFAYSPPIYQANFYDPEDFDHGLTWVEITDGYDIFDDGKILILHTPGHTPGHCSALVELPSGPVVLAGDISYLSAKMRERHLSAVVWNPDLTVASWERVERIEADRQAALLFTHDQDFREAKHLAPQQWYE